MNSKLFWQLIDLTRVQSNGDSDKHAELLADELIQLSEDQILGYHALLHKFLDEAYTHAIWEAAFIINCYCSDDSFLYFRAWLVSQGKEVYEQALLNPESLVDMVDFATQTRAEAILYASYRAYESKTNTPLHSMISQTAEMKGEEYLSELTVEEYEAMLREKYPKLSAKFGDCDDWLSTIENI